MAIVILTLGGVIFQDFEIPEKISAGGSQGLDVKKYLGGKRTIDATGRDDDNIEWSGRFRGSTAEQRCQLLDQMRVAGTAIALTWSTFSYQVVIDSFKFEYQQPFEITYTISLTVLADNTKPIPSLLQSIDQIFGTDLANSLGFGTNLTGTQTGIDGAATSLGPSTSASATFTGVQSTIDQNIPQITGALNTLQTDSSTIQTLTGISAGPLAMLTKDIGSAQGITQTTIGALNGQVTPVAGNVFGSTAGLPPQTIAANVTGQASAFASLGNLLPLGDTLTKMAKNLATTSP